MTIIEAAQTSKHLSKISCVELLSALFDVKSNDLYKYYNDWKKFNQFYQVFLIPKKVEGFRVICRPTPHLMSLQRKIVSVFLRDLPLPFECHGFRPSHSIYSNAISHIQQEYVINLDLKDFFPSITSPRVFGMLRNNLDLPVEAIRYLTRLTTFNGHLPQGAPSSPYIANLLCRRLDNRLSTLAYTLSGNYTRYADDLTFSGDYRMIKLIPLIKKIINSEGFAIADHKTRIYNRQNKQIVTGLIVNDQVSVPRETRRMLRAAVHRMQNGRTPLWNGETVRSDYVNGYIHFVQSIHPQFAAAPLSAYSATNENSSEAVCGDAKKASAFPENSTKSAAIDPTFFSATAFSDQCETTSVNSHYSKDEGPDSADSEEDDDFLRECYDRSKETGWFYPD